MSNNDGSGRGPSAGWYDDGSGAMRWWSGTSWTEHVQQPATQAQQPIPRAAAQRVPAPASDASHSPWYTRQVVWAAAAAVVVLFIAIAAAGAGSSDSPNADAPSVSDGSNELKEDPTGVDGATTDEVEPEPVDTDGDGVNDADDYGPEDPKVRTRDDVDSDGDRVPDYQDSFPKNAKYSKDSDGDRVADQLDDFPKDPDYSKDSDNDRVADSVDAFPRDPSRSEITLAVENALAAAEDYLDYSAFSRQGLVDQLSSAYGSDFKVEDSTWAVSQLTVDWKQQAVRSAKEYLAYSPFSRQGLIDQLSSSYGSQFTVEEATYAANKLGL